MFKINSMCIINSLNYTYIYVCVYLCMKFMYQISGAVHNMHPTTYQLIWKTN